MNEKIALKSINDFIRVHNYTYTVDELLMTYVQYYKKGFYISETTKNCIEWLKTELEFLYLQYIC